MRRGFFTRLRAILFAVGVSLWLTAGAVMVVSADSIKGSLTLICKTDNEILTGLHWDIYRVGSRDGEGFVLDGEFGDYPVDLSDLSVEGMNTAAKTLENYAVLDKIPSLKNGETDEDGLLTFENLRPGLYLVSGEILVIGDTTYVPSTLLFEIDSSGEQFDLQAYPKIIYKTLSSEMSRYTVKKFWMNENNQPADALTDITVEIYCDRDLYDTVTLNSENDWSYSWTDSSYHEWRVKEVEVPDGCTVKYDSNEFQYAIVNTFSETENPSTEPTEPTADTTLDMDTTGFTDTTEDIDTTEITQSTETTEITITTDVTDTTDSTIPVTSVTTNEDKIPQTGQLWWPVPVLGLLGLVFTAAGLRVSAEEKRENENEKN